MLDEPSMPLAQIVVERPPSAIRQLNHEGLRDYLGERAAGQEARP